MSRTPTSKVPGGHKAEAVSLDRDILSDPAFGSWVSGIVAAPLGKQLRKVDDGAGPVLFVGAAGSGKLAAAMAIARRFSRPLYRVDLGAVTSKYIGETEQALDALFAAAEGAAVVLLFDEADALFGKRTQVRDAHDRYANIETAYFLERLERFQGVVIVTSNAKAHLDPAFLRRMRHIVLFPPPRA